MPAGKPTKNISREGRQLLYTQPAVFPLLLIRAVVFIHSRGAGESLNAL